VTITIEAIFFKIRYLLLEWSGQLIFLGLTDLAAIEKVQPPQISSAINPTPLPHTPAPLLL
jgi:hypothetical protein